MRDLPITAIANAMISCKLISCRNEVKLVTSVVHQFRNVSPSDSIIKSRKEILAFRHPLIDVKWFLPPMFACFAATIEIPRPDTTSAKYSIKIAQMVE
jgi:hypothetical protein